MQSVKNIQELMLDIASYWEKSKLLDFDPKFELFKQS